MSDDAFLSCAAAAVNKAADELAADNLAAQRLEQSRFEASLRRFVEFQRNYANGGFTNLLACVSNLAEKLADESPEFSKEDANWRFRMEVMDAAMHACDLNVREAGKKDRAEALAKLRELVGEIKP